MANENIKGITIQIGGDTQPLNKALQDADKKSQQLADELEDLNKKLKLDPGNIDLLTKKQENLREQVSLAEDKLDDLNIAWKKARDQFNKGEISDKEFEELSQEVKDAEKKLGGLEDELKDTEDALDDAARAADDATDEVEDLGDAGSDLDSVFGFAMALNIKDVAEAIADLAIKAYEYVQQNDEVTRRAEKLRDRIKEQKKAFQDAQDEIETNNTLLSIQATMIGNLDKALKTGNLTEEEAANKKTQLKYAVEKFNAAAGESVFVLDEETGALKNDIKATKDYIEQLKKRAKFEASYDRIVELYAEINGLETENIQIQDKINEQLKELKEGVAGYTDETNYQISQDSQRIANNNTKIDQMNAEIELLTGITGSYSETTEAVKDLTDAEAAQLLARQQNGETLSEIEQQQLSDYQNMYRGEQEALGDWVEEEKRLLDLRVDNIRNTNNEIELDEETSLKDRLETIKHNAEIVANYEDNLLYLTKIALNESDAEKREKMLSFIDAMKDYSLESMDIVDEMVKDFKEGGGELANEFIDAYIGAEMPSKAYDEMVLLGKDAAAGLASQKDNIDNQAQRIANSVEKIFKGIDVHIATKGNPSAGKMSIYAYAQGGIVTHPTVGLVGEAGPEAIIPLDRLGGIIESALAGSSVGVNNIMNVYPQSMSEQEQEALLDRFDRRFGDRTARRAI